MKKGIKYLLILIIILTFQSITSGQSPEKFTYQAVVRDATDLLLTNQLIGLQITILNGAVSVYVESFTPTTNTNALVSVEVGTGTVGSGVFANIDWGTGTYYIKADIDPTGGTAYTITGSAQLLSVPYAFYSKTAENGFSGDWDDLVNTPDWDGSETKLTAGSKVTITGTGTSVAPYMVNAVVPVSAFEHYIGEEYDEGIIYYIYANSDGLEVDLIVNKGESGPIQWNSGITGTGGNRSWDGWWNFFRFWGPSPAKDYVLTLGDRWFIPSIDELSLLYQNRFQVEQGLAAAGGTPFNTDAPSGASTNSYWSSSETLTLNSYAWYMSLGTGEIWGTPAGGANTKGANRRVRAVRATQAILGTPMEGGVIAYIFKPTDPPGLYVPGETHGIIVSLSDQSAGAAWGCSILLGGSSDVGGGTANTNSIVAGCLTPGIAAKICYDYVNPDTGTGVYTDWVLPTVGDMGKISLNQSLIGGLPGGTYWTSTDGTAVKAYAFIPASQLSSYVVKTPLYSVRAIRYF